MASAPQSHARHTRPDRPVGLIGAGNLGRAVGLNLIDNGWPLRVLDRQPERSRFLVEAGAEAIEPAGLIDCDLLCFVVPDETGIADVLESGRLLEQLGDRHAVVVLSTILPSASRDLADRITATGAGYVECPVSGGDERARAGRLTCFLAGEEDDIAAVQPFLDTIGDDHHRLGPVGAGSAAKLANQLIMLGALGAIQEGIRLAGAYGVGENALLAALTTGTADTWVGRNWGFFDRVAADYNEAGVPLDQRPWVKDLREVLTAAESAGQRLPIADVLSRTVAEELEAHARQVGDR